MFYEVLMEKRAGRYKDLADARIRGPVGRYILGGALAGGAAGRMYADEDHKTRDMLLGATGGGLLGAGASRFHKALKAHQMKSKGARANYEYDGVLPEAEDVDLEIDPDKFTGVSYEVVKPNKLNSRLYHGHGEYMRIPPKSRDPLRREAWLANKDILSMNEKAEDLVHDMGLMRERELLRGGRNLALGAGVGLGLSKLRQRDKKERS